MTKLCAKSARPPSPARVILLMQLLEPFAVDVRVDLGGGDVLVAEEELHRAEVGASFEQVGGEGMAQHVGIKRPLLQVGRRTS